MDESELTRKAIEELMTEMDEFKERECLPQERKINPLGKPNKRFLGRTINSMLTHNKRQSDRNHQQCQRKLKELDAKQRNRDYRERYRNHRKETRRRSKSDSSHEVISSSEDEERKHKKNKKRKKKKNKKRKKKQKSSSSSSVTSSTTSSSSDSDSSSSTSSSSNSRRKKWKHKTHVKQEYEEDYYPPTVDNDPGVSYYVDPNMAYAAMAYNQMNHMLHQQQILQQQIMKEELEETVEIPSDLSLSCLESESSLNVSLNSSSAEEDENGLITFNLSSDDGETGRNPKKTTLYSKRNRKNNTHSNNEHEDDNDSVQSHISLESEKSQGETPIKISEILLLSSSSSDSEIEIVETAEKVKENTAGLTDEISRKSPRTEKEETDNKIVEKEHPIEADNNIIEEPVNTNKVPAVVEAKEKETSNNISMVDLTDD